MIALLQVFLRGLALEHGVELFTHASLTIFICRRMRLSSADALSEISSSERMHPGDFLLRRPVGGKSV
jgi:hypothetical protein